jgi:hypothetical protein
MHPYANEWLSSNFSLIFYLTSSPQKISKNSAIIFVHPARRDSEGSSLHRFRGQDYNRRLFQRSQTITAYSDDAVWGSGMRAVIVSDDHLLVREKGVGIEQ